MITNTEQQSTLRHFISCVTNPHLRVQSEGNRAIIAVLQCLMIMFSLNKTTRLGLCLVPLNASYCRPKHSAWVDFVSPC